MSEEETLSQSPSWETPNSEVLLDILWGTLLQTEWGFSHSYSHSDHLIQIFLFFNLGLCSCRRFQRELPTLHSTMVLKTELLEHWNNQSKDTIKKDVYKKSNNTACALLHTSSFIYFLILLLNDDVLAETRVWEMNKLDRLVKFTGLKVKKK